MSSDPRHHYHHGNIPASEKKSRSHRHSPSSSTSSNSDSESSSSSESTSSSSSYHRRGDGTSRSAYGKLEDKKRGRSKDVRKGSSSTGGERSKPKKMKSSSRKRSSSSKGRSSRKLHSSRKEYKDYEYNSSKARSGSHHLEMGSPHSPSSSHHHHHHHHHHRSSKHSAAGHQEGLPSSSSRRSGDGSSSRKSRKSSPSSRSKSSRHKSSSRDERDAAAMGHYRTESYRDEEGHHMSPDRYGGGDMDPYDHLGVVSDHYSAATAAHRQHHSSSSSSKRERSPKYSAGSRHAVTADPRTEHDVFEALHKQDASAEKGRRSKQSRGEHEFLRNHEVVLRPSRGSDDYDRHHVDDYYEEHPRDYIPSYDRYPGERSVMGRSDPVYSAASEQHYKRAEKYYDKEAEQHYKDKPYSSKYDKYESESSHKRGFEKDSAEFEKRYEGAAYEKKPRRDKRYGDVAVERELPERESSRAAEEDRYPPLQHRRRPVDDWPLEDLHSHHHHHHPHRTDYHHQHHPSRSPPPPTSTLSAHHHHQQQHHHHPGSTEHHSSGDLLPHMHHHHQPPPTTTSTLPQPHQTPQQPPVAPHNLPPHHHPHNQPPPGMQPQQQPPIQGQPTLHPPQPIHHQQPPPPQQQQQQQQPMAPIHQLPPPQQMGPPTMTQPPPAAPPPQFGGTGGIQFTQPPPSIRPMGIRAPTVGPTAPSIRGPMAPNIREVGPGGGPLGSPIGPPFRARSADWSGSLPPQQQQWERASRMSRSDEYQDGFKSGGWSGDGGGGGGVGEGGSGQGDSGGGGMWGSAPSKRVMHPQPQTVPQETGGWSGPRPALRDTAPMLSPSGDPSQGRPPFARPPMVNLHRPPPSPTMLPPRPPMVPQHPPPNRHSATSVGAADGGGPKRSQHPPPLGRGLSGRLGAPPNLNKPPPSHLNKPPPNSPTAPQTQLSKPPPPQMASPQQSALPADDRPVLHSGSGSDPAPVAVSTKDLLEDIDDLSDFSDDTDDLLNRDGGTTLPEEPCAAAPVAAPAPVPTAAVQQTDVAADATAATTAAAATTPTPTTAAEPETAAPGTPTPMESAAPAPAAPAAAAAATPAPDAAVASIQNDAFEEEETMDLEEISDDDLEDERQAKFTVCDALTINWGALTPLQRPQAPTTAGVMSRFSAAAILQRIGVSCKYARPAVIGEVLWKCGAQPGLGLHDVSVPENGKKEPQSLPTASEVSTKEEPSFPSGEDSSTTYKPITSSTNSSNVGGSTTCDADSAPMSTQVDTAFTTPENVDTKAQVKSEPEVTVPAVVCNTGVVKLLKFRPRAAPPQPDAIDDRQSSGPIDDEEQKKKASGCDVQPSEEILLLKPDSVALSARQDIVIRQDLCRSDSLSQLLTVHSLPHQPVF